MKLVHKRDVLPGDLFAFECSPKFILFCVANDGITITYYRLGHEFQNMKPEREFVDIKICNVSGDSARIKARIK